jgi:hypothetical protein
MQHWTMKTEELRNMETAYQINAHVILLGNELFTMIQCTGLSNFWTYPPLEKLNAILIGHQLSRISYKL